MLPTTSGLGSYEKTLWFDQRPLWKAPEIHLDGGRDSGSRIQLREGALASLLLPHPKSRCKNNLAQAVWRSTLATDANHREIDRLRQIGLWSILLISEFQLSAFPLCPNPPFAPPPVRPPALSAAYTPKAIF